MYVYIYDDYLNKNKYTRTLNKLEIRLTDLGLSGKIVRLGAIKNVRDLIQHEIKTGAKTIVAVGNNGTLNKIISSVIDNSLYDFFQKNILLFIIPIGENNSIAQSLGIRKDEAPEVLLARRIEKIDIGTVGKQYFLNKAVLSGSSASIEIEKNYTIELEDRGEIEIINLANSEDLKLGLISDPRDGQLDVYAKGKNKAHTRLKAHKIRVLSKDQVLTLDESMEISGPAEIGVIQNKLNFIVGKERGF